MKNLLYLLVAILLSPSLYSSAQTTKEQHPTSNIQLSGLSDQQRLKELVSMYNGTYQLRISNEAYAPLQSVALLDLVLDSREQNTYISISLDEFTTLFIPSLTSIDDDFFVPLDTIIYLSDPTSIEMSE